MDRRTLLRSALLAAASIALAPINGYAANDVVMRFQQRYQGLTSIRCSFSGTASQRGTLAAVRGGKFRLTTSERIIISDGSSVYNVTPSAKTVIVNTFNPRATDVSIERVFFEVLTVYRASLQASNGVYRTLRLVPPSPNAMVNAVRELSVTVHANTLAVTSVTVSTDAGQFTFAITQLKINAPVPASTFVYKAPTDWEVIDLR